MPRSATISFYRAGLFLILGLILAVCALGALDLRSAAAQTYTPNPGMDPAEEAFRFRKWLERTKPSDFTTAQQAKANQQVLTNAARSRLTGLGPHLVRGGLAGVAAGVWIHNGITLYNAWECGEPSCPPPLHLDGQFRRAMDGTVSAGASGATFQYTRNGQVVGSGMVLSARYTSTGNSCTLRVEVESRSTDGSNNAGFTGMTYDTASTAHYTPCGGHFQIRTTSDVYEHSYTATATNPIRGVGSFASRTPSSYENGPGERVLYGGEFSLTGSSTWSNPVFDWGENTVVSSPPAGSYEASGQESHSLFQQIQQTTAAPEAPPETTPETQPDEWPEEWEGEEDWKEIIRREWGDDPAGWPNADPDEDGDPNKIDPDDDGDGLEDEEDDDRITPLPDNDPRADPDEDGEPNESDPDNDNDNIPDEDDPNPETPDEPQTLPFDHPYSDPDGDGIPNRQDTDDDGDGVEDSEDPAPFDPAIPQPEPEPGSDRDADDVPDRIDPYPDNPAKPARYTRSDRDEDFLPDPYDPAPDDPSVPEPSPSPRSDTDGDGQPNQHDPFPEDSTQPEGDPDLDGDGQPNRDDPDPYRHDQPEGGPSSDPDGDGYTNEEDPFPNDQNQPENQQETAVCPIAKKPKFEMPELRLDNVFPFSLVLFAFESFGQLAGGSDRPCFNLPYLNQVCAPNLPFMGLIRPLLATVGTCGMCFWFYRYISGKGGSNEG